MYTLSSLLYNNNNKLFLSPHITETVQWQITQSQHVCYQTCTGYSTVSMVATLYPTCWQCTLHKGYCVWLCGLCRPTYTDHLRRPVFCHCWPMSVELFWSLFQRN